MLRSSRAVLRDPNALQRLERCLGDIRIRSDGRSTRFLSSVPPKRNEKASQSSENSGDSPKQAFVNAHLEPGEWDIDRKDPYFRPKPPRISKLISAEDFANRNPVAFDGDFESYSDGMISFSWLDENTCRKIYQMYIDMMILSQEKHQQTSHEYVCRVIAQKFNITTIRAAGVVQLQHAEEQMRRHKPELLCEKEAKFAEERILQNIKDAYKAEERSDPPREFLEDPVGAHGRGEPDEISHHWTIADDLYDLDQKLEQANVRDAKHARLLIDGHVYKEDVDESRVEVRTDAAAKRLLKAQQRQKDEAKQEYKSDEAVIPFPETNAQGEKRPRWKYVAKVVNTRSMKKKGRKIPTYTNNNTENTLVEHDGELRVATVEEAKQTAWKPTRNGSEYVFEGAKKAWLQKTLNGKTDVWGRQPLAKSPIIQSDAAAAEKEDAAAAAAVEESSSSDESDLEDIVAVEEEDSTSDEDEDEKDK